jgi:voltage-gated potassium channel Kch
MKKITLKDRLRYAFDNSLSRGPIALIGWLALASLVIVLVAALAVFIFGLLPEDRQEGGFVESAWQSLLHAIDAGTVAGDETWLLRLVMFLVTIGGIFIVSALIGVLTSGLENKLDELRKGRSFVIEEDHTLILGWSGHIFPIISELVIANENAIKPRIVILADKDKVEMEDEIRSQIEDTGKTKIICRSGNPIDLNDLEIVNPHQAKSIIILSPETENPDAEVIKAILAITNNPNRRLKPYNIIAEIRNEKNKDVAKLVGRHEAKLIISDDLISKITVQTAMQTGLSAVYTELLDFGGDEIYIHNEPRLIGKTFAHALRAFRHSSVIGICKKDGHIKLNPPMDTIIYDEDKIIVIAENDDRIHYSGVREHHVKDEHICKAKLQTQTSNRTLILGWNRRAATIVSELDNYVTQGSQLMVVAEAPDVTTSLNQVADKVKNLEIYYQPGDITDRQILDSLNLTTYQHIILLCYSDTLSVQEADAKTLITLLHLRDIEQKHGEAFSIVSEMLDLKSRTLAEVTKVDDFIVSNKLTSLLLTQVSENKDLLAVFEDLFDAEGSELYLKPASDYVVTKQPVNFYTVIESALRRNEVAIGYRLLAQAADSNRAYGVVINPKKSDMISFDSEDKIIVLAES